MQFLNEMAPLAALPITRHPMAAQGLNPQPKLVLILPTSEGWKPESSYMPGNGVEPLNCMIEHALQSVR